MATQPRVQLVQTTDLKKQQRRHRRPRERFLLKYKPYELCPFLFHPVLPGDSIDSAFLQARVVTDKVKSNLVGWTQEKRLFYVPLRAVIDSSFGAQVDPEGFRNFWLSLTTLAGTTSGMVATANSVPYYQFKEGARWQEHLYNYVVRTWYRDEDETAVTPLLDTYPAAQLDEMRESWMESLKLESTSADDAELPGVDEMEEQDILAGFTTNYSQWEHMRDTGTTNMNYRDWLVAYGINPEEDEFLLGLSDVSGSAQQIPLIDPEEIGKLSMWSYPTLAPQPGDSASSNVLYWTQAKRFDKRFFFEEMGLIVGITVSKPKIYLGNQKGHAIGLLSKTAAWQPPNLWDFPYTSVDEMLDSATDGIFQALPAEDYWFDYRDVFEKGGQFINYAATAAHNALALPNATFDKYPTEALMDSLFSTVGSEYVYEDGSVHFDLMTKLGPNTTTR